jgi:tetratricopeptide (TPR) repeat protein
MSLSAQAHVGLSIEWTRRADMNGLFILCLCVVLLDVAFQVYLSTACKNREIPWARFLYLSTDGFRTDIANMTREDIFESAMHFLHIAIITTPLFLCIAFVVGHLTDNEEGIEGLSIVGFCVSTVWFLTAAILCFRGLLRSKDYIPPDYEQEVLLKSLVYTGSKNWIQARLLVAKATKLLPHSPAIWSAYGVVSAHLGDYARAKEAYEQALSIYQQKHHTEPLGPTELLHEIKLLVMLRRNKEAERLLSRAQSQYPEETQLELCRRTIPELAEEMSPYIIPKGRTA